MKYCQRCVMPDTRPGEWGQKGGLFDKEGVCLACRNFERRKEIDWDERYKQLERICDELRGDGYLYDCVIPVSGGKDSHYLVYLMKEKLDMTPLLVNVSDPFTHTQAGEKNLHNISDTFNCDLIQFRINENLFRRAVRSNFEEFGHPLILVEQAIYTVPANIASRFDVPFLIQGEDPNYEYGTKDSEYPTSIHHIKQVTANVDYSFWEEKGLLKDGGLSFLEVPIWNLTDNVTIAATEDYHLMPIFLSYYDRWDGRHHMEIAKRYGFRDLTHEWIREGNIENYDQIDTIGWLMALWLKYPKFGFSRATDIACRWIREGRISRNEAITLVNIHDSILDQNVLDDFLAFTGYSVREFWDIVERFWNTDIFEKVNGIWKKKDENRLQGE